MNALPRLLQVSLIDLIGEHRQSYEERYQIPHWWRAHVKRFALSPERLTHPESGPLLLCCAYWVMMFLPLLYQSSSIKLTSLSVTIPIGVGISCIAYQRKAEVTLQPKLAMSWTLLHFIIPMTSVYLFGREAVAWWLWESGERCWTDRPWREEDAVNDIIREFDEELDQFRGRSPNNLTHIETSLQWYTFFARTFRARYQTKSPYFVDSEGEVLRRNLLKEYLSLLGSY